MSWLATLDPILQAFLAGLFTWAITALGALLVVVRGIRSDAAFDAMLGFASGVMLAASFWSLLAPAIEIATLQHLVPWVPAAVGFAAGAVFLAAADRALPHLHPMRAIERAEGPRTTWSQTTLLILAITLHNIPEGLAVGVAFGALSAANQTGVIEVTSLGAAVALAVGIGLQNFPEGAAVALPLRAAGVGARRAFLAGTASAAVEPVAAVIGAAAVIEISQLLPYALSFAAGAMVFVVLEELVPLAHQRGRADVVSLSAVGGFMVMMILDVSLG
ncbi:MAG TPA: ZIP family metal transporter [Gemmatimonadaceae bacterium]